jgi:hypothetical protein
MRRTAPAMRSTSLARRIGNVSFRTEHCQMKKAPAEFSPRGLDASKTAPLLLRDDLPVSVDFHVLRAVTVCDRNLVLHATTFALDLSIDGFAADLLLGRC